MHPFQDRVTDAKLAVQIILFLSVAFVAAALLTLLMGTFISNVAAEEQSIDRAQFMLECVAEWGYRPDTCEAALQGESLPTAPECGC